MSGPEPVEYARQKPSGGGDVIMSLISAGLFLYVGFGLGLEGVSDSAIYNGSVTALVWGARIVGLGLLFACALWYLRVPGAAALDLVLAAIAAGGCLVVGVVWLAYADIQGILLLLFGLLNGSAARGAWQHWKSSRRPPVRDGRWEDAP